jgi:hypothetical protein
MTARIWSSFKQVYRPKYIILNIAVAVIYYFILVYLIRYQNYGILIITVPAWLIYALVATSSIVFTIGIYSAAKSFRKGAGASASTFGTAITLFTGIIVGCGCSSPILYSIAIFGLSIAEVSIVAAFIARYSIAIISAILAINIILILYYSLKISSRKRR